MILSLEAYQRMLRMLTQSSSGTLSEPTLSVRELCIVCMPSGICSMAALECTTVHHQYWKRSCLRCRTMHREHMRPIFGLESVVR